MADPNNPLDAPVENQDPTTRPPLRGQAPEVQATSAGPWTDPRTGQSVSARDTLTWTEWCLIDPALGAADEAAYGEFYKPQADAQRAAAKEIEDSIPGSAFASYYGPAAEQKMDRNTVDLRIEAMRRKLEMDPVGQIPGAPIHPPGTPEGDDPQPWAPPEEPPPEGESEAQRREREAAAPPAA